LFERLIRVRPDPVEANEKAVPDCWPDSDKITPKGPLAQMKPTEQK
jgi:hypothetical protein